MRISLQRLLYHQSKSVEPLVPAIVGLRQTPPSKQGSYKSSGGLIFTMELTVTNYSYGYNKRPGRRRRQRGLEG